MNRKYFLRGLGLGLIISAIVMIVAIKNGSFDTDSVSGNNSNKNYTNIVEKTTEEVSEEETEAATEEATEEETKAATEEATEEETEVATEEATEEETEVATEEATEEETEAATEEATEEETEAPTEATTEQTKGGSITVSYGNSAQTVASKLHDIGVIDDEEDFYMYMYNNGYASKILQGTFEFTGDETYEDIAKKLTH